jgi:hypothetical protein
MRSSTRSSRSWRCTRQSSNQSLKSTSRVSLSSSQSNSRKSWRARRTLFKQPTSLSLFRTNQQSKRVNQQRARATSRKAMCPNGLKMESKSLLQSACLLSRHSQLRKEHHPRACPSPSQIQRQVLLRVRAKQLKVAMPHRVTRISHRKTVLKLKSTMASPQRNAGRTNLK